METTSKAFKGHLLLDGQEEIRCAPITDGKSCKPLSTSKSQGSLDLAAGHKRTRFLDLFKLLKSTDRILLALAIIFSCWQGVIFPIFSIVFGNMGSSFVKTTSLGDLQKSIDEHFYEMLFLAGVILTSSFIAAFLWNYLAKRQSKYLRNLYFQVLLAQNSTWFDAQRVDEMSTDFVKSVNNFSVIFSQKMNFYFVFYAQAIGGLLMGLYSAWLFTVFVLMLFPLLLFALYLSVKSFEKMDRKRGTRLNRVGATLEQAFRLIKPIKILNGEEHELMKLDDILKHDLDKEIRDGYRNGLDWGFFLFCTLSVFALTFYIGILFVSNQYFNDNTQKPYSVADIISVIFCIIPGLLSLANIGPLEWALESGKTTISKIVEISESTQKEKSGSYQPSLIKGKIEFKNVSFSYPSNPDYQVISNLSFVIKPGQKIGIVGSSGCGKTTIIQLLERFYDVNEGEILIDGVNIKDFGINSLRQFIGVVSQQPVLITDTIYENIILGCPISANISQEDVLKTLDKVNGKEFVVSLENKLDTIVSNGGNNLSNGQKQKIAVARTLIKNPTVYLFDESTSAFDKWEEKEVHRRLEKIIEGSTNIHVAHKINSVINSDVILVMHQGRLVEQGTHTDLLQIHNGLYRNLVLNQETELSESGVDSQPEISPQFNSPRNKKHSSDLQELKIITDLLTNSAAQKSPRYGLTSGIFESLDGKRDLIFYAFVSSVVMGSFSPLVGFLMSHIIYDLGKLEDVMAVSKIQPFAFDPAFSGIVSNVHKYILSDFSIGIIAIVCALTQFGSFNHISSIFLKKLKSSYMRKLMYTDAEFFDKTENQPGNLSLLLTRESQLIQTSICQNIPVLIHSSCSLIISITIGIYYSWRITLVSVALAPVLLIYKLIESRFAALYEKNGADLDNVLLTESLSNIKLIRSLNAQEKFIQKFTVKSDSGSKQSIILPVLAGLVFGFSQLLNYLIYGVIFVVGTKLAMIYNLDLLDTLCAIFVLVFSINSLLVINEHIAAGMSSSRGYNEVRSKMHYQSKIEIDPTDPENQARIRGRKKDAKRGQIEFRDVTFSYGNCKSPVLKEISFVAEPKSSVGVFGQSSSGKSSICELLLRFYEPDSGQILIDGVDIKELDLGLLRSLFGVIRQDTQLFNGDISYNIAYNLALTESQLLESAGKANVTEFTSRDPEGFTKNVGNKGEKMSGGQKQRILLARTFAREQKICLFDEPTSALDASSETIIFDAIERLGKDKTSITFSNRVKSVKGSSLILVLDRGSIIEQGSYEELIARKGFFAQAASL